MLLMTHTHHASTPEWTTTPCAPTAGPFTLLTMSYLAAMPSGMNGQQLSHVTKTTSFLHSIGGKCSSNSSIKHKPSSTYSLPGPIHLTDLWPKNITIFYLRLPKMNCLSQHNTVLTIKHCFLHQDQEGVDMYTGWQENAWSLTFTYIWLTYYHF